MLINFQSYLFLFCLTNIFNVLTSNQCIAFVWINFIYRVPWGEEKLKFSENNPPYSSSRLILKATYSTLEDLKKVHNIKDCHINLVDIGSDNVYTIVDGVAKIPRMKYKCYSCSTKFISKSQLNLHRSRYPKNECSKSTKPSKPRDTDSRRRFRKKSYVCFNCYTKFSTKEAARLHRCHRGSTRPKHASKVISKHQFLKVPIKDCQIENGHYQVNMSSVVKSRKNVVICTKYMATTEVNVEHCVCDACNRIFLNIELFAQHVIYDRCSLIEKCPLCQLNFKCNRELYKHVATHHNKPICNFCFEICESRIQLSCHKFKAHAYG